MSLSSAEQILDVTYITFIYVTVSIIFALYFSKCIGHFDKGRMKDKSTLRIIGEIYANFIVIALTVYIINILIENLPYPMGKVKNFNHDTFLKLDGGLIFGFIIFYYQVDLSYKIDYLLTERFGG